MSSFKKGLYIVSTPIGNLEDITFRAIKILRTSDFILCEDTRHSLKLLNKFNIKTKLISYHKFNEKKSLIKIIQYLNEGKILSLISDAGTPVLSDPGNIIINECIKNKHQIFTVPGPSSVSAAVSLAGFGDKFLFYGFLPKTENELNKSLKKIDIEGFSLVFFVPAIKINFYIKHFKKYFTGRNIFIAREMTKKYETYYRQSVDNLSLFKTQLRGELTIVISQKIKKEILSTDYVKIENQVIKYLKSYTVKDVVELMSKKERLPKKIIYNLCIKNKKK
jgi:16S rRNA (cytidine1402-2'-O)-methyltransferase